jgi:AraC family transcriptional regulator
MRTLNNAVPQLSESPTLRDAAPNLFVAIPYNHWNDANIGRDGHTDRDDTIQHDLCVDPALGAHVFLQTRQVAAGSSSCAADHPQFTQGSGPHTCFYIAFHRTSVALKIGDAAAEVLTPNSVSLHNIGESYSRKHVGHEGDECDWIAIAPALLENICAEMGMMAVDSARPFPFATSPISAALFFAQRKIFAALSDSGRTADPRQHEQAALGLVKQVIAEAMTFWGVCTRARRQPRPTCQRRRVQIIEQAKAILAQEYSTDLSLADLANTLHRSAAHLSRLFRATTGFKLSDYRQDLRLRRGLLLLEESNLDIGDIAIRVGFASHSHFTSAFNRRFGSNPSQFLQWKYRIRRDSTELQNLRLRPKAASAEYSTLRV